MQTGTIIINKKGNASIKPEGGKELSVPKEFVFDVYRPASGKKRLPCEFEGNPISRILIEGKEVPKNQSVMEQKEANKQKVLQQKAEAAKAEKAARAKKQTQKAEEWQDSFDVEETRLPLDTRALLNDADNFHLKLNKAARFIQKKKDKGADEILDKDKFVFFKNDYDSRRETGHQFKIKPNFGNFNFAQNCQKHLGLAKDLCAHTTASPMSIDWRLVVGLGQASVYETSMTLHHIYGIPYIPASSIKGVVRSWQIRNKYLDKVTDKDRKDSKDQDPAEKLALDNEQFCDIFGCGEKSVHKEARQGKIVFFDAFPCAEPALEVDIMNPHYGDYYSDDKAKTPPADYLSPVPIPFLTVGRQAAHSKEALKFQFVLGIRQNSEEDKDLLATAVKWLNEALSQQGIGAKTAVGYGYMGA